MTNTVAECSTPTIEHMPATMVTADFFGGIFVTLVLMFLAALFVKMVQSD
jgi:hypothetical protein